MLKPDLYLVLCGCVCGGGGGRGQSRRCSSGIDRMWDCRV